jgi:hypothetical protein
MRTALLMTAVLASLSLPAAAFSLGDLENILNTKPATPASAGNGLDALSSTEMSGGLKDALGRGAELAVNQLGKPDGFFANQALRIPLPANLKKIDKTMRMLGMGQQADALILSMNRAAEAAVPEARTLLVDAVKTMSIDDARGILTGGKTSATEYFRKKTEAPLTGKFLPIVKQTTGQVGLAQTYNQYAGLAAQFGLVNTDQASIEAYVTQQALDRLYRVIGEQEQAIRANPLQAGTDLAKKVFGAAVGK